MLSRCTSYVNKFLSFSANCLELNKSANRASIKRTILDATIGLPIKPFVDSLNDEEKNHLIICVAADCPVTCSRGNEKNNLSMESSPMRIIHACKKLRSYFTITESQTCRGCSKRINCKYYLNVDRDNPELSDIALMVLGFYNICRLYIGNYGVANGYDNNVSKTNSFLTILKCLERYLFCIKNETGILGIPHGDYKQCCSELRRMMKQKILAKLQKKLTDLYNIPNWMSLFIMPKNNVKMTKRQHMLRTRLYSMLNYDREDIYREYIWVPEPDGCGNGEESPPLTDHVGQYCLNIENEKKVIQLDLLNNEKIEFRFNRQEIKNANENIEYYDTINNTTIRSVKTSNLVFLDLNEVNNQSHFDHSKCYKGARIKNVSHLTLFLGSIEPESCKRYITDIVKIPFESSAQSSGESNPPISDKKNNVGGEGIKWKQEKVYNCEKNGSIDHKDFVEKSNSDKFKIEINQAGSEDYLNVEMVYSTSKGFRESVSNAFQNDNRSWNCKNGDVISKILTFPKLKEINN